MVEGQGSSIRLGSGHECNGRCDRSLALEEKRKDLTLLNEWRRILDRYTIVFKLMVKMGW